MVLVYAQSCATITIILEHCHHSKMNAHIHFFLFLLIQTMVAPSCVCVELWGFMKLTFPSLNYEIMKAQSCDW